MCTKHHPAGAEGLGIINNRGFLFQVNDPTHGPCLIMYGTPNDTLIPPALELQRSTGLAIQWMITSGDFHHLYLSKWMDALPSARFVMSELKFPTTRNGMAILADEAYKSRITLTEEVESLPEVQAWSDTVQFISFNQGFIYTDQDWMAKDATTPATERGTCGFVMGLMSQKMDRRFLAVWAYHKATKTIITEHNWSFTFSQACPHLPPP